jgi:hypothetical protein
MTSACKSVRRRAAQGMGRAAGLALTDPKCKLCAPDTAPIRRWLRGGLECWK